METLRCPTCLAVLADVDATRCQFCRSRLKARRGVVLREETRITSKPTLALERDRKARVDAEIAAAERRRDNAATRARLERPHAPRLREIEVEPPALEPAPSPPSAPAAVEVPASPVERQSRARLRRERRRELRVVHEVDAEVPAEVEAPPTHTLFEMLSDYVVATPLRADAPTAAAEIEAEPEAEVEPEPEPEVEEPEVEVDVNAIALAIVVEPPEPPALVEADALARLRVEVKADALKRSLEPDETPIVAEEAVPNEPEPEVPTPAADEWQAWRAPRPGRHRAPQPMVESEVADDEAFVEEVAPEPAAEPALEAAAVESLFTPVVDEPRARRARRFGRRRVLEPEVVPIAAALDAQLVDEPVVDDVIADAEVEQPVAEHLALDEVVADAVVDEPAGEVVEAGEPEHLVEAAALESLFTSVVREPRTRRGRRFGRRRAAEPEVGASAVADEPIVEELAADEVVADAVVEGTGVDELAVDEVVEDAVVNEAIFAAVAIDDIAAEVIVDEPVAVEVVDSVDESMADEPAPEAAAPPTRRGRRFGRRRAGVPEVVVEAAAGKDVEASSADEPVLDERAIEDVAAEVADEPVGVDEPVVVDEVDEVDEGGEGPVEDTVAEPVIAEEPVGEIEPEPQVADVVADGTVVEDAETPEVRRKGRFGRRRARENGLAPEPLHEVASQSVIDDVLEEVVDDVGPEATVGDALDEEIQAPVARRRRRLGRRRAHEPVIATGPLLEAEARAVPDDVTGEPVVASQPDGARETADELAARVDASVDALMAFIPETLDETAAVEPPAIIPESAPDEPVEQAIARVDASVQALMRLLPGSTEPEPVVEVPAPVVHDEITDAPIAAVPDAPVEDVHVDEPPVEEAPLDKPAVDDAATRVDASVDALMNLLPGTVEVDPLEAATAEPLADAAIDAAVADAEPAATAFDPVVGDTDAEIVEPRRGWRAAKRARVEAALKVFAAEIEVEDIDARIEASVAPTSDDAEVEVEVDAGNPISLEDTIAPPEAADEAVAEKIASEQEAEVAASRRRRWRRRAPAVAAVAAMVDAADAPAAEMPAAEVEVVVEPEVVEAPAVEDVVELEVVEEAAVQTEPSQPRWRLRAAKREAAEAPAESDVVIDAEPDTLFDVATVPEVEPAAAMQAEVTEVDAFEPEEMPVVAQVLEFEVEGVESNVTPIDKQRRRRRFAKRAKSEEDVPATLFESAWPPAPTLADVPEPVPDSAPAASADRVVDFARPPIEGTVVAGVVEPEPDRSSANGATGWRIRPDKPVRKADAPAAREVVIPEIVGDPASRWATPPTAEPAVELTDGAHASDVEVVEARKPAAHPTFDLPERTRAVRIKTVKTNGKRRWVVDVLVKQPDEDDTRK